MRCDFRGCRWRRLLQGCNYNKRKTGQRCTRLLQRRAVVVYDGPRSSLGIGPSSDDVVGHHREFARRFAEGIGKLVGNTPGDRLKKTRRLAARMLEAAGLAGGLVFTQRRSIVDTSVPQEVGLRSEHRPVGAEPP
ncbi:hypothetical protein B296_00005902 [Ensete ventricosum]|uniref:Uncharacterized protein n=1 Tax=Ensete ventricosum TaxID=4639 RepID=A0A426XX50_ENSVE|nr:hypothetical protein B296_00005902 [Ensete ventricosum]